MPALVAEILLGHLSPKALLLRLAQPGDRNLITQSTGGLGKGLRTPEALRAFTIKNDECHVKDLEALNQLSLLFKHGRKAEAGKPKIRINKNKEAICLALMFMMPATEANNTFKLEAKRRLDELYSTRFQGHKLPPVTVLSHIHQLSLSQTAPPTTDSKNHAPEFTADSPAPIVHESETKSIEPTLSQSQIFTVVIEEQPLTTSLVSALNTTPSHLRENKEPEPLYEETKSATPPSKNSYHAIAEALAAMNTHAVLIYDGEPLAAYKAKQKDYLVGLLPSWDLNQTRYLLRLMIQTEKHQRHDGRFDIIRHETTPARSLFGLLGDKGATTTWHALGIAVKKAVLEKIQTEKRTANLAPSIKIKLRSDEYNIYLSQLSTNFNRFYQAKEDRDIVTEFEKTVEKARRAGDKRPL
jgi:hypothetical protein